MINFAIALLLLGIIILLAKINKALIYIHRQLVELNTDEVTVDEGEDR